jgi:hypothetical protein
MNGTLHDYAPRLPPKSRIPLVRLGSPFHRLEVLYLF